MEYEYGGRSIDPMPDFSRGKFFAHARIVRVSPECDADTEVLIERDLARFDPEDEAIPVSLNWAIDWINTRNVSATGRQTDRPTFAQDNPGPQPARSNVEAVCGTGLIAQQ